MKYKPKLTLHAGQSEQTPAGNRFQMAVVGSVAVAVVGRDCNKTLVTVAAAERCQIAVVWHFPEEAAGHDVRWVGDIQSSRVGMLAIVDSLNMGKDQLV